MISTDRLIFDPGSQVSARLAKLAAKIGDLRIIVWSKPWQTFDLAMLKNIDLITCQDPFLTGLIGLILKKFLNLPLELQLHTDVLAPNFRQFNFKNLVYYWLAKNLLPRANLVRVVSEKLKCSLIEANLVKSEQIYVLPIFVEEVTAVKPSWFTLIPTDTKVVLSVGRLESEKRLFLALEALNLLTDKKIMLVIVGVGSEFKKLKNLTTKLNLTERVIFAGRLTPAELAGSYQAVQVLLHTAAYEGYGLVLAEAAQTGLPIVSTDVGIAREVGALIVPAEPVELAVALEQQLLSSQPTSFRPISTQVYLTTIFNHWSQLVVSV